MGWRSVTIPKGHTWESYMHFLLATLPPSTRQSYLDKLHTSIAFWRDRGGVLSSATVDKLRAAGVRLEVLSHTNYRTDKLPVRMEYVDEVDIAEFSQIPSYKRMCICILKNDHQCKYMGFSPTKYDTKRRRVIMEKYRSIL
jgi:predicted phosphoadenosine phosphosulfate sulfurtransferase